jgi:hypothetical protein
MIITELYNGQGLGNQLWSYVVTRTLAYDKGFDFGIMNPHKFKGKEFLDLDFGCEVVGGIGPEGGPPEELPKDIEHYFVEKDVWYHKFKCDIRDFDNNLLNIYDKTKIEGYFQSEKYIIHRKNEIKKWLKVKPEFDCYDFSDENICVLNIRGGEYKGTDELILPREYWINAINNMLRINENLEFIIISDDLQYARKLLPQYKAFHFNIGLDYSIVKNAKYLILANSSFSFFPAWTSETIKYVIAPKYWARHNISDGFWACAFNMYQDWNWQDRSGQLFTFDECEKEYSNYITNLNLDEIGIRPPAKSISRAHILLSKIYQSIRKNIK